MKRQAEKLRTVRLSLSYVDYGEPVFTADAKDAEINDFLFAVERTAKRNHSI